MQLGYYLVLFLDVLGQREKLRNLTVLPTAEENINQVGALIRDTVGAVQTLRDAFSTSFEAQSGDSEFSKTLAPEMRERLREIGKFEVRRYVFSDSIIISVPLHNSNEHCTPMNGVYCTLFAACSVMTVALTQRIPLRGGIDVGLGVEMSQSEVYGSALERAYFLESRKAGHPRIVVGEEMVRYLRAVEWQTSTSMFGKTAVALASKCLSAIFKDGDGSWALDFLGSFFKEGAGGTLDPNFLKNALKFAETEKQKWSDAGKATLAHRYDLLLAYLHSRSAI